MNLFHRLTVAALIVAVSTNFVCICFEPHFCVYSNTICCFNRLAAGNYLVTVALSGFWFGSFVDRNKEENRNVCIQHSLLDPFPVQLLMYIFAPSGAFNSVTVLICRIFAAILLSGVIAGLIYFIAIPTLITSLVPEIDEQSKRIAYHSHRIHFWS